MSKLRVHSFSLSLDGFGAGPNQSPEHPLGAGGLALHAWVAKTQTFQTLFGDGRGETGVDDNFVAAGFDNVGAWILGRNMFGPVRDDWPDEAWKGWWGDNPPYHTDVFILSHHQRAPVSMEGGTTFHFVTDGIYTALERAKASANGRDVRLGGGVNVVRQYMQARLVDEMHFAISPVMLGAGEHLFAGINVPALGYACTRHVTTPNATHFVLTKQ